MAVRIRAPRINNNDDQARLSHCYLAPGDFFQTGDPIADLETDKATFTVEAEQNGYFIRYDAEPGSMVAVGSTLAWAGENADEKVPENDSAHVKAAVSREPTLKARILLAQFGLRAQDVPARADRLDATDVESFVISNGLTVPKRISGESKTAAPPPSESGRAVDLTRAERGMLTTVQWQKEAVPAYVEIPYDPRPWDEYAAVVQHENRMLMNPLLALFAHRLVRIAAADPDINATISGDHRYVYDQINLGFTVQSGPNLYAVTVRDAAALSMVEFVKALSDLQRSAMKGTLRPENVSGATIGFSSMARWQVSRHIPVLLPHTAIMIAHAATVEGLAYLGITYDHRLLHGAAAFSVLKAMAQPAESGD